MNKGIDNGSSDEEYMPSKERMNNKQNGKTPMNNQAQNEQTNKLSKQYKLSKSEQRRLHDRISGQGYDYKEIENIIKNGDF